MRSIVCSLSLAAFALGGPAAAQHPEGVAPLPEVATQPELPPTPPPAVEEPAPAPAPTVTEVQSLPAPVAEEEPLPSQLVRSSGRIEAPTAADEAPAVEPESELSGRIGGWLRLGYRGISAFQVDDVDTRLGPSPFDTRLRVAPEVRYGRFGLLGEFDTAVGSLTGLPSNDVVFAQRIPTPSFQALNLRQAYFEYKAPTWVFRAGQQAASWGLGLLANNGSRDAAPGDFGESRFGDLNWRALLAGRPLHSLGGVFRAIEPAVGVDLVAHDEIANFYEGDRALQGIVALRFAVDAERYLGFYSVLRQQRAEGVTDGGRSTDVFVFDVAGKWKWKLGRREITAGFEVVSINGSSTVARSDTAPVQAVRQFGAAFKTSYKAGPVKVLFDGGYASGDQNPFDDKLEAFRFDPDYRVGLVLFDQVLGWQSSRSAARASDLSLVGVPPEGVDLLPTQGAVSGAWYLFPRASYGLANWLDIYGGPLLAFSSAKLTDPFNTRTGGGAPLNSLGGSPGNYLGTELDLGLQARFKPHEAILMNATAEGGLFLPGDAFTTASGGTLAPVAVARIRLGVEL